MTKSIDFNALFYSIIFSRSSGPTQTSGLGPSAEVYYIAGGMAAAL